MAVFIELFTFYSKRPRALMECALSIILPLNWFSDNGGRAESDRQTDVDKIHSLFSSSLSGQRRNEMRIFQIFIHSHENEYIDFQWWNHHFNRFSTKSSRLLSLLLLFQTHWNVNRMSQLTEMPPKIIWISAKMVPHTHKKRSVRCLALAGDFHDENWFMLCEKYGAKMKGVKFKLKCGFVTLCATVFHRSSPIIFIYWPSKFIVQTRKHLRENKTNARSQSQKKHK